MGGSSILKYIPYSDLETSFVHHGNLGGWIARLRTGDRIPPGRSYAFAQVRIDTPCLISSLGSVPSERFLLSLELLYLFIYLCEFQSSFAE